MNVEFSWTVLKVEVVPKFGPLENVVKRINFQITGGDVDSGEISALAGETLLLDPKLSEFVEYKDIRESQMIAWVKEAIGTRAIFDYEEELRRNLRDIAQPDLKEMSLPWIESEEDKVYLFKEKR